MVLEFQVSSNVISDKDDGARYFSIDDFEADDFETEYHTIHDQGLIAKANIPSDIALPSHQLKNVIMIGSDSKEDTKSLWYEGVAVFVSNIEFASTHTENIQIIDEESLGFIERFYDLKSKNEIIKATVEMYKLVDELLIEKKFQTCDKILKVIEVDRLSVELNVGLLRITYPAKNELVLWNHFYNRVSKKLQRDGRNEKKLLRGLR